MDGRSKNLLIVDDDEGIRRSLARIMCGKGYRVKTAGDGESAVATAKTFRPDLLIMDIRMPGIDGVEAFSRIRGDNPHATAIFMTAYSSSNRVSEALQLGAHSVFAKPLDVDSLCESVEEALREANVLIVHDDPALLDAVLAELRERGIEAVTTQSTDFAIESLRRHPRQVVLVVGNDRWPDGNLHRELDASVQWISKPIDVDALIGRIDQLKKSDSR